MTRAAPGPDGFKYTQIAAGVRAQVAGGSLRPGGPAPSGAALARRHGCSVPTARKALRVLVKDGTLVPGPTSVSRLRIAGPGPEAADTPGLALARTEVSAALAARRRAAALTQPELAACVGCSVTSIGHAETGRLWQSRRFWEQADKALNAGGELLTLHDSYRAAADAAAPPAGPARRTALPAASVLLPRPVLEGVILVWSDGTTTTVTPPAPQATSNLPGFGTLRLSLSRPLQVR